MSHLMSGPMHPLANAPLQPLASAPLHSSGIVDHNGNPFERELNDPSSSAYRGGRMARSSEVYALPHVVTFSSIFSSAYNTYSWRWDEALRTCREDALAMRRDCFLMGILQERRLAGSQVPWHLEPEDATDKRQKATASYLTKIIERMPGLARMFYNLLDGTWYGRYGAQVAYRWEYVDRPKGVRGPDRSLCPVGYRPLNGDKIQYQYRMNDGTGIVMGGRGDVIDGKTIEDGTPVVLIHSNSATHLKNATTVMTDRGQGLLLREPYWRERFVIYTHEPDDADFFEGEMAGGVWGVGIRSRIYWLDWIRKEWLANVTDYIQKVGQGVLLFYYEQGNPESEARAIEAANNVSQNTVIVWPRPIGSEKQGAGVDKLDMPMSGSDTLVKLMEHLEAIIERYIIGQSMSSGADNSSGLGGTGRSQFAADTKFRIIKFDTQNLADCLTHDLVRVIQRWNCPHEPYRMRFVFDLDKPNAKDQIDAINKIWSMGGEIRKEDAYSYAGISKPQAGDEVLSQQQSQGGGGAPGMGGPSPSGAPSGGVPAPGGAPALPGGAPQEQTDQGGDGGGDDLEQVAAQGDIGAYLDALDGIIDAGGGDVDQQIDDLIPDVAGEGSEQYAVRELARQYAAATASEPRVYLGPNEEAPEGVSVQSGPHGGRYYTGPAQRAGEEQPAAGGQRTPAQQQPQQQGGEGGAVKAPIAKVSFANDEARQALGHLLANVGGMKGGRIDAETVPNLVGLVGGGDVQVTGDMKRGQVTFRVKQSGLEMVRTLSNENGKLVMKNEFFRMAEEARGKGVGSLMFAKQVAECAKRGVSRIECNAAGGPGQTNNGYYTWPRLGYNARIPMSVRKRMPMKYQTAFTVQGLLAKPGGMDWWKENGEALDVSFDCTPFSRDRQALAKYLGDRQKRKGGGEAEVPDVGPGFGQTPVAPPPKWDPKHASWWGNTMAMAKRDEARRYAAEHNGAALPNEDGFDETAPDVSPEEDEILDEVWRQIAESGEWADEKPPQDDDDAESSGEEAEQYAAVWTQGADDQGPYWKSDGGATRRNPPPKADVKPKKALSKPIARKSPRGSAAEAPGQAKAASSTLPDVSKKSQQDIRAAVDWWAKELVKQGKKPLDQMTKDEVHAALNKSLRSHSALGSEGYSTDLLYNHASAAGFAWETAKKAVSGKLVPSPYQLAQSTSKSSPLVKKATDLAAKVKEGKSGYMDVIGLMATITNKPQKELVALATSLGLEAKNKDEALKQLHRHLMGGPGRYHERDDEAERYEGSQEKVYLKPGEEPPEGVEVQQGERGGRYYVGSPGGKSSKETMTALGSDQPAPTGPAPTGSTGPAPTGPTGPAESSSSDVDLSLPPEYEAAIKGLLKDSDSKVQTAAKLLNDLDADYKAGKISKKEYGPLRKRYLERAGKLAGEKVVKKVYDVANKWTLDKLMSNPVLRSPAVASQLEYWFGHAGQVIDDWLFATMLNTMAPGMPVAYTLLNFARYGIAEAFYQAKRLVAHRREQKKLASPQGQQQPAPQKFSAEEHGRDMPDEVFEFLRGFAADLTEKFHLPVEALHKFEEHLAAPAGGDQPQQYQRGRVAMQGLPVGQAAGLAAFMGV